MAWMSDTYINQWVSKPLLCFSQVTFGLPGRTIFDMHVDDTARYRCADGSILADKCGEKMKAGCTRTANSMAKW
jgi:hypothetical protein